MTRANLQAVGAGLTSVGTGLTIASIWFGADVFTLVSKRSIVVWDFFLGMGIVLLIQGAPILLIETVRQYLKITN